MSLFAGIYAFHPDTRPDERFETAKQRISATISRSNDEVHTYESQGLFVAKVDLGIYEEPAFRVESPVVFGAGRLVLPTSTGGQWSRTDEFQRVATQLLNEPASDAGLQACAGTFSIGAYAPQGHRLVLATDRFGARPVYWYRNDNFVYFASALRVLESLDDVKKCMDVEAVAQSIAFGSPLGDRTPYSHIKLLRSGEKISLDSSGVQRSFYFRWDQVELNRDRADDMPRVAYEHFVTAVGQRASDLERAICLLSGGLDSRCAAVALQHLGRAPLTVTFETRGIIDDKLAIRCAEALEIENHILKLPSRTFVLDALLRLGDLIDATPQLDACSRRVFSGDGGSVGVGFVYVDEPLVAKTRSGDLHAAAEHLVFRRLGKRLYAESVFEQLQESLYQSVFDELRMLSSPDPGRHAHLFFLNNDQRTHLHKLFENTDIYRIEYELPFMDGRFMEYLLSVPADRFIGHRFYHEWIQHFPAGFMAVPWQTYPGHLPCPVKSESAVGRHQWQRNRRDQFDAAAPSFRKAKTKLKEAPFPSRLLNRSYLKAAIALHGLRVRSYGYVFDSYLRFQEYFEKADGVFSLPPQPAPGRAKFEGNAQLLHSMSASPR